MLTMKICWIHHIYLCIFRYEVVLHRQSHIRVYNSYNTLVQYMLHNDIPHSVPRDSYDNYIFYKFLPDPIDPEYNPVRNFHIFDNCMNVVNTYRFSNWLRNIYQLHI